MHSDYQQLVRNPTSRGLLRELGLGIACLIAIVLGCLLLPDLPGESAGRAVGSAPPKTTPAAAEILDPDTRTLVGETEPAASSAPEF